MPKKPVLFKNTLKLEETLEKVLYKFTLNPDWSPDPNNTRTELEQFRHYIYKLLLPLENAHFTYCIEFSPVGRLHIHGYICIKDILGFYMRDIPKIAHMNGLIGINDEKLNKNMTWDDYCYKQQHIVGLGWITIERHAKLSDMVLLTEYTEGMKIENQKHGLRKYDVLKTDDEIRAPPNSPKDEESDGYDADPTDEEDN